MRDDRTRDRNTNINQLGSQTDRWLVWSRTIVKKNIRRHKEPECRRHRTNYFGNFCSGGLVCDAIINSVKELGEVRQITECHASALT